MVCGRPRVTKAHLTTAANYRTFLSENHVTDDGSLSDVQLTLNSFFFSLCCRILWIFLRTKHDCCGSMTTRRSGSSSAIRWASITVSSVEHGEWIAEEDFMHVWCFTHPLIVDHSTWFRPLSMICAIFLFLLNASWSLHLCLAPLVKWSNSITKQNTKKQLPAVSKDWHCCTWGNNKRARCAASCGLSTLLCPRTSVPRVPFCFPEQSRKKWRKDQDHRPLKTALTGADP